VNLHVVIDAHRQLMRCNHCRTEAPVPAPGPILAFSAAITRFEGQHARCAERLMPGPMVISAGPGMSFKRDAQGLWWAWTLVPNGPQMGQQVPEFRVNPLPLDQALAMLRAQAADGEASDDFDLQRRAQHAVQALASEGVFV
jgi:hypothetical protein